MCEEYMQYQPAGAILSLLMCACLDVRTRGAAVYVCYSCYMFVLLRELYLGCNKLSGSIPESIGELLNLR